MKQLDPHPSSLVFASMKPALEPPTIVKVLPAGTASFQVKLRAKHCGRSPLSSLVVNTLLARIVCTLLAERRFHRACWSKSPPVKPSALPQGCLIVTVCVFIQAPAELLELLQPRPHISRLSCHYSWTLCIAHVMRLAKLCMGARNASSSLTQDTPFRSHCRSESGRSHPHVMEPRVCKPPAGGGLPAIAHCKRGGRGLPVCSLEDLVLGAASLHAGPAVLDPEGDSLGGKDSGSKIWRLDGSLWPVYFVEVLCRRVRTCGALRHPTNITLMRIVLSQCFCVRFQQGVAGLQG